MVAVVAEVEATAVLVDGGVGRATLVTPPENEPVDIMQSRFRRY